MKSIIIDPGHGGRDPGAQAFGVKEKDWNLKMSLYQYDRLKSLGAKVAITRTTDQTLDPNPRAQLIKNKYDYCISNHFNAFNSQARGVETIHSIFAKDHFARKLAEAIVSETGLPMRRVFSRKNDQGRDWYFMHRLTGRTQTVIVEYGFLDNRQDFDYYQKDFYKAGEAVVKVICQELGIPYRPKAVETSLYRVQVGAFQKRKNAEALAKDLEAKGFSTYITQD